MAALQLTSF